MKSRYLFHLLLVGLLCLVAGTRDAQAQTSATRIRIYRFSSTSKATFNLNGINQNRVFGGYLVYDAGAPGNSQTVEIYPHKFFTQNMALNTIVPNQFALFGLNTKGDAVPDVETAEIGFSTNGATYAGLYLGAIPHAGFKLGGHYYTFQAKTIKGGGATAVNTQNFFEFYSQKQTLTLDALSVVGLSGEPPSVDAGVNLVLAKLASLHYQVKTTPN